MFKLAGRVALTALALTLSTAAFAQYPNKVIRIISPAPPGGSTDIVARLIAPGLQEGLKQPVIVEARGGAGGYLGSEYVSKAPADGYTLLLGGAFTAITATLQKNPSYDPRRDLVPVAIFAAVPNVMVAGPKLKANNVAEVIAQAKAAPGTINVGSNGVGTTLHLSGELFKLRANLNMVHVAYRGWADCLNAVATGEVDMMFDNLSTARPAAAQGKTRILAVQAAQRHRSLPDVPTLSELGIKDAEVTSFFGIWAPAGTPKEVIAALTGTFREFASKPEFQKSINDQGMDAVYMDGDAVNKFWTGEVDKWVSVIRAANITAQ